jgi:hypothetical protein
MGKMEADLKALIESYFGAFEPAQVVKLLENVDKAMDKKEWAAATVAVTRVLEKTKKLFEKVYGNSYTQERKAEINAIVANINGLETHVVVFKKVEDKGSDWNDGFYYADFAYDVLHETGKLNVVDATEKILSDLTVFILRAATYAEITGIEAAIDNAMAVKTFKDDIAAWRDGLYTIGGADYFNVVAKNANGVYENQKWAGLGDGGTKYHNTAVAKDGIKKAQVATAAHRADFNAARTALERLVVEYTLDAPRFATNEGKGFVVKSLYVGTKKDNPTKYEWATPGSYAGEAMYDAAGASVSALVTGKGAAHSTADGYAWTFKGVFAAIDATLVVDAAENEKAYKDMAATNWAPKFYGPEAELGEVMAGHYDEKFLDPKIKIDLSKDASGKNIYADYNSGALKAMLDVYTPVNDAHAPKLSTTYNALEQMIKDAEYANDYANKAFTGLPSSAGCDGSNHANDNNHFLWHIGYDVVDTDGSKAGHQCGCKLKADDNWYVNNLKDFMVEQTETEAHNVVPGHWSTPIWLTPVHSITGVIAPWNHSDEQANTIDVIFNYAHNINREGYMPASYGFITRYDLYLKLVEQAWKLLYEKYKAYAAQVLLNMKNDYRVAAMAAVLNASEATYADDANVKAAAEKLKLVVENADHVSRTWSPEFVSNYFEGTNKYIWYVGTKIQKQVGPDHKFAGLDQYYEYNNMATYAFLDGDKQGWKTVDSDVLTALAQSQLLIDIELDSVSWDPRNEILNDLADYKDGMSEFDWKKTNIGRVQDAFDAELAVAKANFDEIMYRYMHKEINDAYVNFAYAAVNAFVATNELNTVVNPIAGDKYSTGIANFFDQNPASTALTATEGYADEMAFFMQVYVTGHSNVTGTAYTDASQGYSWQTKDGKYTSCDYKTAPIAYGNGVEMSSAYVMNEFAKNVLLPHEYVIGDGFDYVATRKVENAQAIYDAAINTMADAAVEFRFNDYIQHAKDAAYISYLNFAAAAPTIDARLQLDAAYNEAEDALTIVQYYTKRADSDYLATFVDSILSQAIAKDSPYYGLIADGTSYEKQLVNVKSSTTMKDGEAAKLVGIYNPTDAAFKALFKEEWVKNIASGTDGKVDTDAERYAGDLLVIVPQWDGRIVGASNIRNYFATGSAPQNYDKVLNGNAVAENGTKLY